MIWAAVVGSCAPDGSPVTSRDPSPPRLYSGWAPSCSGLVLENQAYAPAFRSTTTLRVWPGDVSPTPPKACSQVGIGAASSVSMDG